jgi:hypothetical protein
MLIQKVHMKKILFLLLMSFVLAYSADPIVVDARLTEIPGKIPGNDLYNYVYVFKYKVLNVVKGSLKEKEVLVGVYNPKIPRGQVKDKMAANSKGNVREFKAGAKHRLVLVPLESIWQEALEDEYFDDESIRYFAIEVTE